MQQKEHRKLLLATFIILVCAIAALAVFTITQKQKEPKIPKDYVEIESYNNNSRGVVHCLAMIPQCGVCDPEYGEYLLINGKCYGKVNQ